MIDSLVSIIMPVYNSDKFLDRAISSVINQVYSNWELLLIDDASSDSSRVIIERFVKLDPRVKGIFQVSNEGVSKARNKGVGEATGKYIAFLDSDDEWHKNKLSQQLEFMGSNRSGFSFTGYSFIIGESNTPVNEVRVPLTMSRTDYLKNNLIWTSTVIIDTSQVDKAIILMPNLSYGEDACTWLNVLSVTNIAHGLDKQLAYYRRTAGSLSSNKLVALKMKWQLYGRLIDKNILLRAYYFICSVFYATKKRI